MPDTHAQRITDTATLIPNKIPISTPSLDDHLQNTAEQLITLLCHKSKNIGPFVKNSTKQELLRLASILHRDKSPTIELPSKFLTSEGATSKSQWILTSLNSFVSG